MLTADRHVAGRVLACGLALMITGCTRTVMMAPAPAAPAPAPVVAGPPEATPPETLDAQALESTATTLPSKVTKVTVYSDRARVTREATIELATEPTVHAFRGLPGWVDDGSVRVAASAGRIVDVRVERAFLARSTDASLLKAEADHQVLTSRQAGLTDELKVLDAQKVQIESIKAFSLEKITRDTTIGNVSVKSYGDVLTFITDSLRATAEARRAVQLQLEKLAPDLQASQRRLGELRSLMQLEETTVLVTLQGSGAAPATIELTYMLPGATWEPMHELRASTTDAGAVEVISFAAVTQTSGEDWGNAELSFSTQSTVQSVRIPELEALTLGDTQSATRILTSQITSFSRAQAAFTEQNQLWNKVHHRSAAVERSNFEETYQSNIEYLQVVQGKTVEVFESLEKRGTTAHFKANVAPSVRGDGHPVRMLIGRTTLASSQRIVAAPEQSLNAARTVAMLNSTGQALLPGKVALYHDGAFLGMTDIGFIAEGETFSLFLGVADHIKLSRKIDRKKSALIKKRRNSMQLSFIVTVENLSSEPTTLTLTDRIPVSENKDIKVDRIEVTPPTRPDSRGLLRWEITLKPRETREFRIGYQVEYPEELLLEPRRKRMESPRRSHDSPSPSRPADIEEQLMDLEDNF